LRNALTFVALLVLAAASIWYSVSPQFPVQLGLDLRGGMRVTLEPDPSKEGGTSVNAEKMAQVRSVLENRVNSFGLSGSEVRLKGENQILVLLPGVKNPEEALNLIKTVAQLEFRHLDDVRSRNNPNGRYEMTMKEGDASRGEPESYTFTDVETKKIVPQEEVLKDAPVIVRGNDLKPTSRPEINPGTGEPYVSFEFNSAGGEAFGKFTTEHVGEILGVVLDQKIISAPNINEPITGGSGTISGGFTTIQEARVLSQFLNSGALPVPLREAETQTVGATLGQESVERSIQAGLVGLGIVALFMLLYYWLPGFIACIALLMYAFITFALFKLMGIVLDLPGITGFILSIGMAVDGNILIFERMKEELSAGKPLNTSIQTGFTRALGAILDSNITVWVIAAILVWLGSPMVKGFAITLAIGNAVAMFTAVTVTRTLLLAFVSAFAWARNPRLYALNNSWLALVFPAWRQGAVLRIFEKRKIYFGISGLLVVVSLVFIAMSPVGMGLKPGIDFTGGSIVEAAFRQPGVTREQVDQALTTVGISNATIRMASSDQDWTDVKIEATDVSSSDVTRIREHLERSELLTGFDPDAYKTETKDKTLTVTAVFTSEATQQQIQRALSTKVTPQSTDTPPVLKGLKVTTTPVDHSGANKVTIAEITTRNLPPTQLAKVQEELKKLGGGTVRPMSSATSIGPSIAREVTTNGLFSVITAVLAMILFLAFRFAIGGLRNGLKFGTGAAFAIVQDVLIVVGFFAIMGFAAGWQVDSLFLTACLGLLGFAVNDVIVVYDRIRENIRHRARGETFADVANRAMTQSFDRSFNTNFFIMLSLAAMAIFGGETLRLFNIAILMGLAVASFTSIYVATPLVVMMEQAEAGRGQVTPAGSRPAAPKPPRRDTASAATPSRPAPATPDSGTDGGVPRAAASGSTVRPRKKRRQ
jgi:preprotein translocase subunit SecD